MDQSLEVVLEETKSGPKKVKCVAKCGKRKVFRIKRKKIDVEYFNF